MAIPLLALAWPAVSASLMTAGRFVVMTAAPAIARFATSPTTLSAAGTAFNAAGHVVKGVWNNKLLTGTALLTIDGALGTNMTSSAVRGVASAVGGVADVTMDGVKNNAKDIDETLTGGQLTAAVQSAAGNGASQQPDKTVVPTGESQGNQGGGASQQPPAPSDQAGQALGMDLSGITRSLNPNKGTDEPAGNEMDDGMKNMLGGFLNIDPKNLNARNLARMMKDFAGDNKLALGLGMYAAYTTDGGPLKKAVAGLVTTMVMSFLMPHLTQIFGPMLAAAGPALANMKDSLGKKFDQASTTGQFNTSSYGLTAPDAAPVQKIPAAEAANDPVAQFKDNGLMTQPMADTRKPVVVNPAPSVSQYALAMNS